MGIEPVHSRLGGQPKVSSFAPYSGDMSSCRASVTLCSGRHMKAYVVRKLFSANPARIARFDGPPASDESFIFLLEVLSRTEAANGHRNGATLYAVF